ncbi:type II toxin-antitoxin system death-on-curing family toxin [Fibrella aquatilis]|uniref:Type II toxin-antitoxin system death-on-curing family toxin n=1 Tax=Fibrella aquatilis TaxID=2817059 RepID=A0A939G5T6_9BACT|nr:type II toxin-antitoxin system death-on-curing family toxin [Fibrella aquatilis]MBO0932416.1 type II toxin-antitoxin system death-on-curing family toxin [Fibrella aquatilis]
MIYLEKEDIAFINQRTVAAHGGNFMPPHNFLHEENLDFLVEAVQAHLFGEPMYPTLADRAAVYCFNIIGNHIFSDGNKRTGLEAALAFLKLNGRRLNRALPQDDLYDFIIKVASGESSLDECRAWFAAHTVAL